MGCAGSKPQDKGEVQPSSGGQKKVMATGKDKSSTVLGKELTDVLTDYELGKVLGKGQFGTTRLARSRSNGKKYACKSIAKHQLQVQEDIEDVRREVEIMHHLAGHKNVTYLRGTYEDRTHVHLIMDLATGGELFDAIVKRERYSEADAAAMIRTIVSVVNHCHDMGVMHRDLKPENFLLENPDDDARLLCTDFGLSMFYKPGEKFRDLVGSAYYVAPDVLMRNYGPEADIWSCGVILYVLLSGMPPFWGETEAEIFNAIRKGELDLSSDPWPKISEEAKDCVKKMLERDPAKRASAESILKHPWLKEHGVASDKPLDNVVLSRLNTFANMNKFKKQAMTIIASRLPAEEIKGLKNLFETIDTDKSGTITAQELEEALKNKGTLLDQKDIDSLLKLIDMDANGTIDYNEFLAATLSQAQIEKEEHLRAAFAHFDTNGDGNISRDELRKALASENDMALTEEEIEQMLSEADRDGNGEIDYGEFCAMIMNKTSDAKGATMGLTDATKATRGSLNAYKAGHSLF